MKTTIYFDLIAAYWECHKHFGLSNGATALYFFLLHKFNGARWPKTMRISSHEVQLALRVSKRSMYRYKDELCECGILETDFVAGRMIQKYTLKKPNLKFNTIEFNDFEIDPSNPPSNPPSDLPSDPPIDPSGAKNALAYIINTKTKTKDKNNNPIVPSGTRDREARKHAEKVYQAYPRKVAKPTALKAIQKQITKYGFDDVISKTELFAKSVQGEDLKFIPHPATFFNQERFNDDPDTWSNCNSNSGAPVKKGVSDAQKLMIMQDQQKQLKQEMVTYRNRHLSQCAMTSVWDQGSKPKYDEMAAMMKKLKEKINELL